MSTAIILCIIAVIVGLPIGYFAAHKAAESKAKTIITEAEQNAKVMKEEKLQIGTL